MFVTFVQFNKWASINQFQWFFRAIHYKWKSAPTNKLYNAFRYNFNTKHWMNNNSTLLREYLCCNLFSLHDELRLLKVNILASWAIWCNLRMIYVYECVFVCAPILHMVWCSNFIYNAMDFFCGSYINADEHWHMSVYIQSGNKYQL